MVLVGVRRFIESRHREDPLGSRVGTWKPEKSRLLSCAGLEPPGFRLVSLKKDKMACNGYTVCPGLALNLLSWCSCRDPAWGAGDGTEANWAFVWSCQAFVSSQEGEAKVGHLGSLPCLLAMVRALTSYLPAKHHTHTHTRTRS